jgi:hypothetical protein
MDPENSALGLSETCSLLTAHRKASNIHKFVVVVLIQCRDKNLAMLCIICERIPYKLAYMRDIWPAGNLGFFIVAYKWRHWYGVAGMNRLRITLNRRNFTPDFYWALEVRKLIHLNSVSTHETQKHATSNSGHVDMPERFWHICSLFTNFLENAKKYEKLFGHKMRVALLSTTVVRKILHSDKYSVTYVRDALRNACR